MYEGSAMPEPSERVFYRSVIEIEVLSENPYPIEDMDLSSIVYDLEEGTCNGNVQVVMSSVPIDAAEAVRRLMDSGSDPEFFGLTEDGADDRMIDEG